MRQIINGKRYDTTTAAEIASDRHGYASDFAHWSETLYRTPRGNYFLSGVGGPMTRWAVRCPDGGRSGGRGLQPISAREARDWLERAQEYDAIEEYFGAEDA